MVTMTSRDARSGCWWAVVLAISLLCMAAIGVTYTADKISDNNRKWCKTITLINTAAKAAPPQGTYGRELADDFHQLGHSFGCYR